MSSDGEKSIITLAKRKTVRQNCLIIYFARHMLNLVVPSIGQGWYWQFFLPSSYLGTSTDKLRQTGQNLGRVFNFRNGHAHTVHFLSYGLKLLNLKLKTRPKQLLDYLLLDITLPGASLP